MTLGGFAACEEEIGESRGLFPGAQDLLANAIERCRVCLYLVDFLRNRSKAEWGLDTGFGFSIYAHEDVIWNEALIVARRE